MLVIKRWLTALLLTASATANVLVSMSSVAAEPAPKAIAETIITKLQAARPDFAYGEVEVSPMAGLYQVQIEGGPLLYVTESGDFAVTGALFGITDKGFVDMRELALKPQRVEKLSQVAEEDMVIFPAEGKRKAYVYVFTDVDCGYCRKLHQEVPDLNAAGIEVRYLAYPRAGIGSPSANKIALAWCAKDKQKALTQLKNGRKVDAEYCEDNPVASQFMLGNELGVTGTPALILADGTLLPGYRPAAVLAQMLGI